VYSKSVIDGFVPNRTLIVPGHKDEKLIEAILEFIEENPYRLYLSLDNYLPQDSVLSFNF
jgi:hypothetical protein